MADSESDPGYRSRSQSRRSRRRKQQSQSQAQAQTQQKGKLPALPEEQQQQQQQQQQQDTSSSAQAQAGAMQPFEHIGPPETSMDGPVTYARAQRGEIPMRAGNPNQQLKTGPQGGGGEESKMMDQDGLKLRLELNLDVEIELKASIRGDLTLALL
jgi:small subunit ribosomal protein S8e